MVGGPVYRLTSIMDRNNNTTTLDYTNGNLTTITDFCGRSLTLVHNSQNKLVSITDPLNRNTTLEYDSTGKKLLKITDPELESIQYSYNFMYQLTGKMDKDGKIFSYVYQNQKPVAIKDGVGDTLFSLANPNNWAIDRTALARNLMYEYIPSTTSKTDGRGNVWQYEYNKHGYLTKAIDPDNCTTNYTYDLTTLKVASMADANGNTTSYEYDAIGNLIKVTDAMLNKTLYEYEPVFNNVTRITDPNGVITEYEYDGNGNRTKETADVGGLNFIREWTYDANGNVLTEKDRNGNVTYYGYDACGNHTSITDPLNCVTTMTYDAVGNMLSRTDGNSHTTTYEYDGLDRLIREIDPLLGVTEYVYDGKGSIIQVIDCNNNSTFYEYDLRDRLVKIIDALSNETTQTYDGSDNRISTTDQNGNTTTFEYDMQNRLIKIITPPVGIPLLPCVTTMTYDCVGNKLTETDGNGNTTTYEYDALNRLVRQIDAVGCETLFEYDMVGGGGCCGAGTLGTSLITKKIDGNGNVTCFKYCAIGRLIQEIRKQGDTDCDIIDADDAVTEYTYDPNGNRLSVTVRISEIEYLTTTYEYDAKNQLIKGTNPAGEETSYTYDCVGKVITTTSPNGNITTNNYDANDRPIQVEDLLGLVVAYTYDCVGNRLSEIDGNGNTTTYEYDAIYRLITVTDPMGEPTLYAYDRVGNLVEVIDRELKKTTHAYDVLNRTDQKGQTTSYVYNDLYFLTLRDYETDPDDTFTYDLSGRMLSAERGGWLVTFEYDVANRVIQTTQNGQVIDYVYDIPNRTRTIIYPNGRVITEQMDLRHRLDTIDDALSPLPIVDYHYDLGNRVETRTYRNGVLASYTYNDNNWILELAHSIGPTLIAGFSHDYDKEGNKLCEEKFHAPTDSEAYQYDAIYQLIDYRMGTLVACTVPVQETETTWYLDPVGNWDTKITDGVIEDRTHNEVNELTNIDALDLLYDDNGNLIDDGSYIYEYDEENRLFFVTRKADGQEVEYRYDALSRRVAKVVEPAGLATETRYFYDGNGWRVLEEQDDIGVTQATYVYGNYLLEVLTMDRVGQTYYYHQNALSSVFALTDATATTVEGYMYEAYGRQTVFEPGPNGQVDFGGDDMIVPGGLSSLGNPCMFTGHRFDSETGLHYYGYRYYNPTLGRWPSRDPIGELGGPLLLTTDALQAASLVDAGTLFRLFLEHFVEEERNLYSFVQNNPIRDTDYLGLQNQNTPYVPPFPVAPDCVCPVGSNTGKRPDPNYGGPTPNGCTGVGPGPFNFTPACNGHDTCYGTCNSDKGVCDSAFLAAMQNICSANCGTSMSCLFWCNSVAQSYYYGVAVAGQSFYNNAQDAACEDCCCP